MEGIIVSVASLAGASVRWLSSHSTLLWRNISVPFFRLRCEEEDIRLLCVFAYQDVGSYQKYDVVEMAVRSERLFRARYIEPVSYVPFPDGFFGSLQEMTIRSRLARIWAGHHPTAAGMRRLWKEGLTREARE